MTRRSVLFAIGTVGPLALAIGIGVGLAIAPSPPDMARFVSRGEYDELQSRLERSSERLAAAIEQKVQSHDEKEELARKLSELSTRLEEIDDRKEPASDGEPVETASTLQVAFGKWAELEAIRNADWSEMGEAVENINALVLDMVESLEKGEPVDVDLQDKIREENNKLVRYAAQVMGKIPTHSPVNGEFSHPLTLANLMGSMLDRSGVPLSEEQVAAFERLGTEYESEYDELQAGYDDNTVRLEKLIDELELKRDAVDGMQGVLSDEQHELVVHPELHHRLQIDTLSPFTMAIMLTQSRNVSSADALREKFTAFATKKLGIDPQVSGPLDAIAESFLRDMQSLLTPVEKADRFLHIDRAITAGRAQANALKQLLSLPGLSESARNAILSDVSWAVPQVVPKAEEPAK